MEEQHKTVSSFSPVLKKIKVESPSQTSDSHQSEVTSNDNCKKKETNVEMSIFPPKLEKIKIELPDQTSRSNQNEITASEKLKIRKRPAAVKLNTYVCFVLKCFDSMHYLHLKQCITYAEIGMKNFLCEFSETGQLEYFKTIPGTFMDENGYLFIKGWQEAKTNFKNKRKMRLLAICILAFEKEMHFKALVSKAIEKSRVVYFQHMSTVHQLNFFKNYRSTFFVSHLGFVKLKLNFMLSECSSRNLSTAFENTNQNASQASNMKEQCKTVSSILPDTTRIKVEPPSQEVVSNQNETTSNVNHKEKETSAEVSSISLVHPKLENIKVESVNQTLMSDQSKNILNKMLMERKRAVARRLDTCVCFLLRCMKSMHYLELKECICYAEIGCRNFLNEFSEAEQTEYFKSIPNTVMDGYGFLFLKKPVKTPFNRFRKTRLLTVCLLAFNKEMHFKDLVNETMKKSIRTSTKFFQNKSAENQLNFFLTNRSKFDVSDDDFVKLKPSFKLPKCSSRSLSTIDNTQQNATARWFCGIKKVF